MKVRKRGEINEKRERERVCARVCVCVREKRTISCSRRYISLNRRYKSLICLRSVISLQVADVSEY